MRSLLAAAARKLGPVLVALAVLCVVPRSWCGQDADGWYASDPALQHALARELIAFEEQDTRTRDVRMGAPLTRR